MPPTACAPKREALVTSTILWSHTEAYTHTHKHIHMHRQAGRLSTTLWAQMLLATRAPKREALKFINMWSNTEAHAHTHGHTHTCTGGQTLHYSVSTNAPNSACTEEGGAQIHYSVATHRSTHTHTCTGGQTLHYSVSTNAPSNACTKEGGAQILHYSVATHSSTHTHTLTHTYTHTHMHRRADSPLFREHKCSQQRVHRRGRHWGQRRLSAVPARGAAVPRKSSWLCVAGFCWEQRQDVPC